MTRLIAREDFIEVYTRYSIVFGVGVYPKCSVIFGVVGIH